MRFSWIRSFLLLLLLLFIWQHRKCQRATHVPPHARHGNELTLLFGVLVTSNRDGIHLDHVPESRRHAPVHESRHDIRRLAWEARVRRVPEVRDRRRLFRRDLLVPPCRAD